jgi:tetratricopeptide (TPR) repeat protein
MEPLRKILKTAQVLHDGKDYMDIINLLNSTTLEFYKSADLYAELARAWYKSGDNVQAWQTANTALAINPRQAVALNVKGNIASENYKKNDAINFYKKAIEYDPKYTNAYCNLGDMFAELKNYDAAIENYNHAIRINRNHAYSLSSLGDIYSMMKDFPVAIRFYLKAIKADSEFTDAVYNLADTYYCHKDYDHSLEYYTKYVELTKNNQDYYSSVAEAKINEIKKLKKNPDYAEVSELVDKIKSLLFLEDGSITHYTSASVTKALILDGSALRLSEGAFLNDTSEGAELYKFLSLPLTEKQLDKPVSETFVPKPFIGSFVHDSKHNDLTLWRMYGKEAKEEAKGCSITFDIDSLLDSLRELKTPAPKLQSSSNTNTDKVNSGSAGTALIKANEEFSVYRVAYTTQGPQIKFVIPGASEESQNTLTACMNDLSKKIASISTKLTGKKSKKQDFVELLNQIAYLFKSAEYQHENELRLVLKGIGFDKLIDPQSNPPRVYIELISVKPFVQKITLGPKLEKAEEWAAAFYYTLNKDDYSPEIVISHLPFK